MKVPLVWYVCSTGARDSTVIEGLPHDRMVASSFVGHCGILWKEVA